MDMVCTNSNCDQQVDANASFCSACGTPMKKSGATGSILGLDQTTPVVQPKQPNIEELKKQKEYLLLQREIAQLEGKSSLGNRVNRWSWKWVAPLGLLAAFVFMLSSSDVRYSDGSGDYVIAILSLVAICPAFLKILKTLHVIG